MTETLQETKLSSLDAATWDILLERIASHSCTPFLGSEACLGPTIPLASQIADDWAKEFEYPLADPNNLARVAQFLGTMRDPPYPKQQLRKRFKELVPPDFSDRNEPHRILAELPLPVYITTTYYDFMIQALESTRRKKPQLEICQWYKSGAAVGRRDQTEVSDLDVEFDVEKEIATPLVYYMYGHISKPESLVLTEDDYLDFLVKTSPPGVIPPRIEEAFAGASLLFLGYRFADLEFRVLLRRLAGYLARNRLKHVCPVQFVAVGDTLDLPQLQGARKYLGQYCGTLNIQVYWGTTQEFLAELRQRWEGYSYAN